MSFYSVAEKSFTGIVTSPKEIAPFQIERGMVLVCLIRSKSSFPAWPRLWRPDGLNSALELVELHRREPQQVVVVE